FKGNILIVTFASTNPRNPLVLSTTVTPYRPGTGGGKAQIANNLFLFGGARDAAGNNLVLQVDIRNPLQPVVTPYTTPAPVTSMAVVGNVLHTTAGAAGYAAYRIPGVTQAQLSLSGSCGGPVNWTLNPPGVGTLTSA